MENFPRELKGRARFGSFCIDGFQKPTSLASRAAGVPKGSISATVRADVRWISSDTRRERRHPNPRGLKIEPRRQFSEPCSHCWALCVVDPRPSSADGSPIRPAAVRARQMSVTLPRYAWNRSPLSPTLNPPVPRCDAVMACGIPREPKWSLFDPPLHVLTDQILRSISSAVGTRPSGVNSSTTCGRRSLKPFRRSSRDRPVRCVR